MAESNVSVAYKGTTNLSYYIPAPCSQGKVT